MAGKADLAARRRSTRAGRRRGVSVYIPAEMLEQLGYSPDEPAPWYRLYTGKERRGRLVVTLYREP